VPSTSGLIRPRSIGILGLLDPDDDDTTKGWNLFLSRYGVTFRKNWTFRNTVVKISDHALWISVALKPRALFSWTQTLINKQYHKWGWPFRASYMCELILSQILSSRLRILNIQVHLMRSGVASQIVNCVSSRQQLNRKRSPTSYFAVLFPEFPSLRLNSTANRIICLEYSLDVT
jgi:hypothetical protein